MKVETVFAQVRPISESDPGQVAKGFYVVDGGELVMTQSDGSPVHESRFRCRLEPGQDAASLARVFTKQIRREALGLTAEQEAMNGPLHYNSSGIV